MSTNVYRGSDATISVAVEAGPAGDKAKEIVDKFALTPIGRATGVTVKVTNDVQPFHELGQRFATEIRSGNVNVSGTIDRAYVNGGLLRLMLSDGADSRPSGTFTSPTFNLTMQLKNPALPNNATTVTIMGVQLSDWSYQVLENEFVLEQVGFRALWVKLEDSP